MKTGEVGEKFWQTAISKVEKNGILVRGFPIQDLMESCSFEEVLYLVFMGELPRRGEEKLIGAILISCVDHGLHAPSVNAARFVASSGVPIQAAVASGINAIGEIHGGAIEDSARMLQQFDQIEEPIEKIADQLLVRFKADRKRVPGLGHPIHTHDPRTKTLFDVARDSGHYGYCSRLISAMSQLSEVHFGKHLPVNVDGAIAALISDMGIPWHYGKGFFIIARCVGLIGHVMEEINECPPFRTVGLEDVNYTGKPVRRVGTKD